MSKRKMSEDYESSGVEESELSDEGYEYEEPEDPTIFAAESSEEVRVDTFTLAELTARVEDVIERLAEVTSLPRDQAFAILAHQRWNLDSALAAFAEDPARLAKKVGLSDEKAVPASAVCCVCYDAAADGADLLRPLSCMHVACRECWKNYLEERLSINQECLITCLASGCGLLVPRSRVQACLQGRTLETYQRSIAESYVQSKSNMKWCPTPDCNSVISPDHGAAVSQLQVLECKQCQQQFCFTCGENHVPSSCQMLREFKHRCDSEGDNMSWLKDNTKECPKCCSFIEKNGGCNWIKCSKCGFEFCWLCGRAIKHSEIDAAGGSHRCNVFKSEDEKKEIEKRKSAAGKLREEDERRKFLHYYGRYLAHRQSSRLEMQNLNALRSQHSPDAESEAVRFLRQAQAQGLDRLRVARQMLWSSYILGFYQKWDAAGCGKEIFEDLQHLLENRTEALSKAIQASFINDEGKNFMDEKLEIIRLTDAVKTNMNNLKDVCSRDIRV
eukprot:m.15672 g.15672  ORF g.15672 m.15672 type:complete len:501 (+) comp8574_c0_seq1:112-1614(+)